MPLKFSPLLVLLAASIFSSFATAQEATKTEEEQPVAEVTLTGTFEAVQSSELIVNADELKSLVIRNVVPHGSKVRKGQVVASFETEPVDEKIEAGQYSLQLARISMEEDEAAYVAFKAGQVLDKAAAERALKLAKQDFDNYQQVDRDRSVANAHFSLKSAEASLANAMEELKQLEQMYKEDELTEESEEIVLKRAQQAVESAEFRFEGTKVQTERTLQQSIPLEAIQQQETLTRAEMAHKSSMLSLKNAALRKEIEIRRKREQLQKQEQEIKDLQAERKQLVITAPHDGIAYHGPLTRGKLSDKPSSLQSGSTVSDDQVLVTLVNPAKLQIRTELTETLLKQVSVGLNGTAVSNAVNGDPMNVRVKTVDRIPYANNKFDCVIAVIKYSGDIVPGTSCAVTLPTSK